jgi:protease-4
MSRWSSPASRWGAALSWPWRALRARRLLGAASYVTLLLDTPLVEFTERRPWWRPAPPTTSLDDVRELAARIAADPRVRGLLLEIRTLKAGSALATALARVLMGLRAAGKSVVVYLPMGGASREMVVAAAAERIILGPQATLAPSGVAIESRYFRRVLEKIGASAEIFARGEFKTAGESLARDTMSNEQRTQLTGILDVLYDELRLALERGRGLSPAEAESAIDEAPHRAAAALSRRLVDATGYDDQLPGLLPVAGARLVAARPYLGLAARRSGPPAIAVVEVRGAIVSRAPALLGGVARVAIDERVMGALRVAREDRRVRGVVLHIDSPGGSVIASDRIHREVVRLAARKPVVALFGNVAASGGYYIAAGAHAIIAEPTCITGSIGVVATHLVLEPVLEKLGIVTERIKRGVRADMMSTTRPFTVDEREAMLRDIDGHYADFVALVARGRGRPVETIEALARGRVYSGAEAARVGLVDRLGGFDAAVEWLAEQPGMPAGASYRVLRPPRHTPRPLEVPNPVVAALAQLADPALYDLAMLVMSLGPAEQVVAYEPRAWSEA